MCVYSFYSRCLKLVVVIAGWKQGCGGICSSADLNGCCFTFVPVEGGGGVREGPGGASTLWSEARRTADAVSCVSQKKGRFFFCSQGTLHAAFSGVFLFFQIGVK